MSHHSNTDAVSVYQLTCSIRDSETSVDFVQGPPGSRRERVKPAFLFFLTSIIMTTAEQVIICQVIGLVETFGS